MLVQGFQNLEHGQHLGHDHPHGRVCIVSPDADAAAKAIRDVLDGVGCEGPVVVEEAFRDERVRVGEPRFVVGHCPGRNGSFHQMRCDNMEHTDHRFAMTVAPGMRVSTNARERKTDQIVTLWDVKPTIHVIVRGGMWKR